MHLFSILPEGLIADRENVVILQFLAREVSHEISRKISGEIADEIMGEITGEITRKFIGEITHEINQRRIYLHLFLNLA